MLRFKYLNCTAPNLNFMKKYLLIPAFAAFFLLLFQACYKYPETIPLNTKICVQTSHHYFPIPDATVYVKFNADSFPGYLQKPEYFDKVFKTGKDARGCIEGVPEGNHYLIAFGYDSLHYPHDVFGNLPVTISLDGNPVVDTMLFVSEKH